MLLRAFFFALIVCTAYTATIPDDKRTACGYQTCRKPDPKKLNIHIVAHSHDDVGWLKTVDQYYFGTRPLIQKAGVQYIIDSYIEALQKDPSRRFIQVETAYFWQWWKKQNERARNTFRQLVDSGRLEIIGGGWSMADEAATHYHSLIDQYTWGFRRLDDTLGKCARPKIGWQIDPFGHSREQAAMFAQLGFDGYFFGRLDWMDKNARLKNKSAEFIWNANPSLGKKGDIMTGILYNTYQPPPGFCFDFLCADEPIVDDVESPEYNVPRRVDDYLRYTIKQSLYYRTNNVLMTMGGDFTYQYAEMYFHNLDKLIRYANERNGSDFNMFYSTPSCYLKALHDENMEWPTKRDDFFPYASDPHAFWTGYFTSRPTLKYFERISNNYLQVVKQLASVVHKPATDKYLEEFREAMGIMQHHDAVTGTEKQHVAEDYARILHKAFVDTDVILQHALRNLTAKTDDSTLEFKSCLLLNISSCEHTETNENFVVTIYNPFSQNISKHVRLPVIGTSYSIRDVSGINLVNQLVPITKRMEKLPGRSSAATHELIFKANDIPPLGFKSFYVTREKNVERSVTFVKIDKKPFVLHVPHQNAKIEIDETNQISIKLSNKEKDVIVPSMMYYEAALGNNMVFENRSSGAYIFRPNVTHPNNFNDSSLRAYYIEGPLVTEVHVEINEWVSHAIKIHANDNFVEHDWLVGPIPIKDGKGKEIIIRYDTSVENRGVFYTDSNGRQMIRRVRRHKFSDNDTLTEPIAGNYYPISNKIYMQSDDSHDRFAVLNDRSQGGSSLNDGQLEIMVHRRLLKDDAFGVEEALNETAFGEGLVAAGKHYIHFGNVKKNPELIKVEKQQTVQLALHPWLTFTPLNNMSFDEYRNKYRMEVSVLKKPLPQNVNILTLEPWAEGTILLRFEHLFEVGECNVMSKPVEFNLKDVFKFDIVSIRETTLGANLNIGELNRFEWSSENDNLFSGGSEETQQVTIDNESINVVMKPSEIRTFIIRTK